MVPPGIAQAAWYGLEAGPTLQIASGAITVTHSVHVIESETGSSDTLQSIGVNSDTLTIMTGYVPYVILIPASGHTITLEHDAAPTAAGRIQLSAGANVDMAGEHPFMLHLANGWWADAVVGGYMDINSTQTINGTKTMNALTANSPTLVTPQIHTRERLRSNVVSYANSEWWREQWDTTTTDATVTTLASFAVAEGEAWMIHATVLGKRDDESAGIVAHIIAGMRRATAGNVTLIGTPDVTIVEDAGTQDVTFDVDTGSQTGRIRVQGLNAENWLWKTNVNYTKLVTA